MVKVNCETRDLLKLQQMIYFQGSLKKRKPADIDMLARSIVDEGMHMPFAIWADGTDYKILDGHGRYEALVQLSRTDVTILDQEFPVVFIQAASEDEARKALLQIVSVYGKITATGLQDFTITVPTYVAPVVTRTIKVPKTLKAESEYEVIKVRVHKDKAAQVRSLLASVDELKVLN